MKALCDLSVTAVRSALAGKGFLMIGDQGKHRFAAA
jgi:hypothetical protein